MTKEEILYNLLENKNFRYLIKDILIGLSIGFTLYIYDINKIEERNEYYEEN